MKKCTKILLSLLLMFCVTLGCVACSSAPDRIEAATEKLEEYGYTVSRNSYALLLSAKGITAKRTSTQDSLEAFYFEESKDATEYYLKLKENDGDLYNPILNYTPELKKKGNWVVWGTDDAIDEFFDGGLLDSCVNACL